VNFEADKGVVVDSYGTTTYILPPFQVLHTDLMDNDAEKVRGAAEAQEKPLVIVTPKNFQEPGRTKQLLMDSGLWFL